MKYLEEKKLINCLLRDWKINWVIDLAISTLCVVFCSWRELENPEPSSGVY